LGKNLADGSGRVHLQSFTQALLEDLRALALMLEEGRIESGPRRIGAEQELFLVDPAMHPATRALEVLDAVDDPRVTTELGLFNLEINLSPLDFGGDCLSRMEREADELLGKLARAARSLDTRVLLTGILPTLKTKHLSLDAMTPFPRYRELNRVTVEHRGGLLRLQIQGLDALSLVHDNVMCEASNTSFQIHFQVAPNEFAPLYNVAQAITAPLVAVAANSPVFLHHRLWHETRLALFQQSIDSRSANRRARRARPRVVFGDRWIEGSVLEVFRDDIARFPVFLPTAVNESAMELLDRGELPPLSALRVHNGTVYRWNRPCYGLHDGRPHLRIEHRALPSGPTLIDEMANAAFFFGLMCAVPEAYGDITRAMKFDDAASNFAVAARYGLGARFRWVEGRPVPADALILEELLPLARDGLRSGGIRDEDVDRYLDVMEERVRSGRTGSQWAFDSLAAFGDTMRIDERHRALASAMYERSLEGRPVHEWELAEPPATNDLRHDCRYVEQIMTTDLFTVRPDDLVDLAASLMDWEHIRHVPVEDEKGHLVGLVSHRQLLRLLGRKLQGDSNPVPVREIMRADPITVRPETTTQEAISRMRVHRVSCLPVVDADGRLAGIVSERDFMQVTAGLLDELLGDGSAS
jgi:CBS domain-containing protein